MGMREYGQLTEVSDDELPRADGLLTPSSGRWRTSSYADHLLSYATDKEKENFHKAFMYWEDNLVTTHTTLAGLAKVYVMKKCMSIQHTH